jgi:hypothetical protein
VGFGVRIENFNLHQNFHQPTQKKVCSKPPTQPTFHASLAFIPKSFTLNKLIKPNFAIGTIIANLQVLKASKASISKDFLKK